MSSQCHQITSTNAICEKRIMIMFSLIQEKMVSLKSFCGAVFSPQDYEVLLKSNIQHLEHIPMSKTFNTAEMLANGRLVPEQASAFYIYRQVYMGHTSFGILGEISIQDYHENRIKKHEKTLHRAHLNHKTYKEEHVGPVVVSYRQDIQLSSLIINLTKQKQQFSAWTTHDGREHTLWRVLEEAPALSAKFKEIENLYILDGHHRMEAAHQHYLLSDKKLEKDLWIQALLFSSEHVVVHPQHRVIQSPSESYNLREELGKLQRIQVTDLDEVEEEEISIYDLLADYEIIVKEFNSYFGINFKNQARSVLEKVSAVRLETEIFSSLLDKTALKDIKYVPGIVSEETMEKHNVVFFVRPPVVETIFQVADQNVTMPPKSTWIEPKPCSHMVIRLL